MKQTAALIALALLLAACGSGSAAGHAVHAQVALKNSPGTIIGVYRDEKGRYTFDSGWIFRYDPSKLALTEFNNGKAVRSTRYVSDRAAWAWISNFTYTPKSQWMRALASGSSSPEPPDYEVPDPPPTG